MLKYDPASSPRKELHKSIWNHFQRWIWHPPLGREKYSTRIFIFGIIFQRWNMTPPSYDWEGSIFKVEIWPNLLSEKGLYKDVRCICGINFQCWNLTLPLVQEKNCTKMLNVYLGPFFNVEIWPLPPPLEEKRIPRKYLYLGLYFNVDNEPPSLWTRRFII